MRREDGLCCEDEDSRRPASEEGREARKENSGVEREEGRCGEEGWDSSTGRQGAWGAEWPFLPLYLRSPWLGLNSGPWRARKVLYTEL